MSTAVMTSTDKRVRLLLQRAPALTDAQQELITAAIRRGRAEIQRRAST